MGLYGRKEDNSRREHDTILTVRPWRIARRNCHRIVSSGGLEAELSSISSPMADASKRNRPEKRSFVTVTVAGSSKENLCPQHCDEAALEGGKTRRASTRVELWRHCSAPCARVLQARISIRLAQRPGLKNSSCHDRTVFKTLLSSGATLKI